VEKLDRPAASTHPQPHTIIHNTGSDPKMITQSQPVNPGLAAGRKVALRTSIMKRGYSDPGWITPGILVVLAAGCIGIWMAALTATSHTPEASVKQAVTAAVTPQRQQPQPSPTQQQNLDTFCGSEPTVNYVACSSLAMSWASNTITEFDATVKLCLGYQDLPGPAAQAKLNACRVHIWGGSVPLKSIYQANVSGPCDLALAAVAKLPEDQRNDLQCSDRMWLFAHSSPRSRVGDPNYNG